MNWVRYRLDELSELTEQRKAELKALAERPDTEIDCSDIPPLGEDFLKRATVKLRRTLSCKKP